MKHGKSGIDSTVTCKTDKTLKYRALLHLWFWCHGVVALLPAVSLGGTDTLAALPDLSALRGDLVLSTRQNARICLILSAQYRRPEQLGIFLYGYEHLKGKSWEVKDGRFQLTPFLCLHTLADSFVLFDYYSQKIHFLDPMGRFLDIEKVEIFKGYLPDTKFVFAFPESDGSFLATAHSFSDPRTLRLVRVDCLAKSIATLYEYPLPESRLGSYWLGEGDHLFLVTPLTAQIDRIDRQTFHTVSTLAKAREPERFGDRVRPQLVTPVASRTAISFTVNRVHDRFGKRLEKPYKDVTYLVLAGNALISGKSQIILADFDDQFLVFDIHEKEFGLVGRPLPP